MDTHVKYILLLLVVTVISIGVSSSVKYDKSSIETHPDMPKAHTPDDNHSGLSQENQNKIKLLQSQFTNLNQEVVSLETTLNNTVPILNSSGDIVFELGTPTLADVNKLFISESINDTQDYGLWENYINSSTPINTFTIQEEISGSYRLELEKYTYLLIFADHFLSTGGGGQVFNFDPSGFLQNVSNEYLVFDKHPNPAGGNKNGFTTESSLVDAYGKYVLKLINATTADKFSLAVVKLLTTPKQTQLYNLEYFGITDNTNLPPPFLQNQYISKSSPFALSDIKQIPSSFTNTLGIFSTISIANNPPATVTSTDFIGLDENITRENYAINVLNTTTPIPDNYILPVHSTTPSYTIPTTGKPFYSIHLLMLNDNITKPIVIRDQNNTKGVQNIVIVCSSRQYNQSPQGNIYHNNYGILERGTVDFITNDKDTINAAFSQKQLYNMFANYNIVSMVVFPLCYEHSEKLQSAIIRDYGVSYARVPTNYLTFNATSGSFNQQYSYVWDNANKTYTKYKHTDPNVADSWVKDY